MLNSLDLLSKVDVLLNEQQRSFDRFIEPFSVVLTEYDEFALIRYNDQYNDYQLPIGSMTMVKNYMDAFVGWTYTFPNGHSIAIDSTTVVDSQYTTTSYIDKYNNDLYIAQIITDTEDPDHFIFVFNGWDVTHRHDDCNSVFAPVLCMLDTQSISALVSNAISLSYKGELNAANLLSIAQANGISLKGDVLEAYNYISGLVSGDDSGYQASGLIEAIKEIYKSAKDTNMSVDVNNEINFHTTEYSVSTAIGLPIQGWITVATTIISSIAAFFSPIFSAIIGTIGAGIAAAVTYLNDAYGNTWQLGTKAQLTDNECFSTPVISGTYSTADVPSKIVEYARKFGYVKCENMFFTTFAWMKYDNDSFINIEVFPNVNTDYRRWPTASQEQAFYNMINSVHWGNVIGTKPVIKCYDTSAEKTNMIRWCDSDFSPADITHIQYPDEFYRAVKDNVSKWCTYSYLYSMLWIAYRYLYLYYGSTQSEGELPYSGIEYFDYTVSGNGADNANEEFYIEVLTEFLCYYNWAYDNFDPQYNPDPHAMGWQFQEDWSETTTALINNVYHAIWNLNKLNQNKYARGFVLDFFGIFDSVCNITDFSSPYELKGLSYKWSVAPCLATYSEMLATPPANRYSLQTRLTYSSVVIATLSLAAIAVGLQVRKYLHYKADLKTKTLNELYAKYKSTNSWGDYSAYRHEVFKYNMTYGLLTGTKYDPLFSAWTNSRIVSEGATTMAAIPSVLSNVDGKTGIAAEVDLDPVIRLIK